MKILTNYDRELQFMKQGGQEGSRFYSVKINFELQQISITVHGKTWQKQPV